MSWRNPNSSPPTVHTGTRVLFFNLGEAEAEAAFDLVQKLRDNAIPAELYPRTRQIRQAIQIRGKERHPFAVIIGSAELGSKTAKLKNLRDGSQKELPFEQITIYFTEIINRS
jgi:histidyl-tRNA synthetase